MTITEVKELTARAELIFKAEYPHIHVTISWQYDWLSKKTYGQCCSRGYGRCLIKLSQYHWMYSNKNGVWNTIVHELCHAYNTHNDGHGHYWKQIAAHMSQVCNTHIQRVGGDREDKVNFGEVSEGPQPVAKFHCPACGRDYYIYRRGRTYQNGATGGYTCGCCHTLLQYTRLK